jgi:hypothetical protein
VVDEEEFHDAVLGINGPARLVKTFIPSITGVAQAGIGLGAFSTSTRHMRQLAAMLSFLW